MRLRISALILFFLAAAALVSPAAGGGASPGGSAPGKAPGSGPATNRVARYIVTLRADRPRLIHVEAVLPRPAELLSMSSTMIDPLPEGYATFVRKLTATDKSGRPVRLAPAGHASWKVDQALSVLRLRYDIDLRHDSVPWAVSGAFARAYSADGAIFFTGRALFIADKAFDGPRIEVRFRLPAGWKIATPYRASPGDPGLFVADGLEDLWSNGSLAGRLSERRIRSGTLDVVIAGTPHMAGGLDLLSKSLSPIVEAYRTIMGGSPEGKLAIVSAISDADGGEAFRRSISLIARKPPDRETMGGWAYLLAHETFHLWNGHAIAAAHQQDAEWFVEGFTEYMAKLVLFRTGAIGEAELFAELAENDDSYRANAGRGVSLKGAGVSKGENYALVYSGGMTAALALDVESRTIDPAAGVPRLMRAMYAEFGTPGRTYELDDLQRIASREARKDLTPFFARYVRGMEVIPLDRYLAQVGLRAIRGKGKTAITRNAAASDGQKALLRELLQGSAP